MNEALDFGVQKAIGIKRHSYPIRDERRAEEKTGLEPYHTNTGCHDF
jgi:hypothetical protein